jgi:hypothetical protein
MLSVQVRFSRSFLLRSESVHVNLFVCGRFVMPLQNLVSSSFNRDRIFSVCGASGLVASVQ